MMKVAKLVLLTATSLFFWQANALPLSGVLFEHFDRSVRIQDNLFSAINGTWIKNTTIPADRPAWGAMEIAARQSLVRSRGIIEEAVQNKLQGRNVRKIGDLYLSFMDIAGITSAHIQPLASDFQRIESLDTHHDVLRYFGVAQRELISLPWKLYVGPDERNSRVYLLNVVQGGLGLPDRDYYLKNEPHFSRARNAYLAYLATLFQLANYDQPQQRAQRVVALEQRLASAQWNSADNRDPEKRYNTIPIADLAAQVPGVDWSTFLNAASLSTIDRLNLNQLSYFQQFGPIFHSTPVAIWKDYLVSHLLDGYAPYLSPPFVEAAFNYYGTALTGQTALPERWQRGVALVNTMLGDTVGRYYVARYFPRSHKTRVHNILKNIMEAYDKIIMNSEWMSAPTRAQARAKLAKYTIKIGYPSTWLDYSSLTIQPNNLVANVKSFKSFFFQRMINRLGTKVNRDEWEMTPQTVDAYYHLTKNEIVLPAGILQPPFFNDQADDAVNYGAIGAVIGHEISHGFDDEGGRFDGNGNLRNWWSDEDRARFQTQTARLVTQYASYEPLPGVHINGQQTLGENIADLSGLQAAYEAWQLSLGNAPAPVIDGLSGPQRFFIGFAQIWKSKIHEDALLKNLVSDPHPPAEYRLIGAAMNSDAFHNAFNVQPGDKMYKPADQRIRIW